MSILLANIQTYMYDCDYDRNAGLCVRLMKHEHEMNTNHLEFINVIIE